MASLDSPLSGFAYKSVSLRNFRGFRRADNIPLAPLTFLVGPNSSGKSSLFDALLLITQSGFAQLSPNTLTPNWSGPLVDLGSHRDTVFNHRPSNRIHITFEATIDVNSVPWRRSARGKSQLVDVRMGFVIGGTVKDQLGRLMSIQLGGVDPKDAMSIVYSGKKIHLRSGGKERTLSTKLERRIRFRETETEIIRQLSKLRSPDRSKRAYWRNVLQTLDSGTILFFTGSTQRVSSGRAAPKRWYPLTDVRIRPDLHMIMPTVLDTVDPSMLDDQWTRERYIGFHSKQRSRRKPSLANTLNELEIASGINPTRLSPYHSAINIKDSITGVTSNLIDVGYGASQVIPILVACLSQSPGPLFIEQPEIHLHPRAQGRLADMLCTTSLERQVIVETHSVHMINRARILVAEGKLRPEHVIVNYITRTPKGSTVFSIPIDAEGEFTNKWPEGFFDERYEDTMTLLKLRGKA